MNMALRFLNKNKRSFVHSTFIGLGCILALQLLKESGKNAFWGVIGGLVLLQLFELYLNWRYATKVLRQIDMPNVNVYNLWGHLLNHILLPILLIITFSGFIYFNDDDLVRIVAIALLSLLHTILFINIRSYYHDEFKSEESTRYVYDLLKLVIFFFGINLILHFQLLFSVGTTFISFSVSVFSLILGFLLIYRRNQVALKTLLYITVMAFFVGTSFMILSVWGIVLLGINLITFLVFYFGMSLLHNKLERTLTLETFLQYIIMLLLALSLFSGIS